MAQTSVQDWLSWLVRFNDPSPMEMWKNQPTFLLVNVLYLFMALMALKFAVQLQY